MSSTALLTSPVEQMRQLLRDRNRPAKLNESTWLHSPLVVQKQGLQPELAPVSALLAVLDDLLAGLHAEQPMLADLLRGRFWEGFTVEEMVRHQRPEPQSTRRFHQQQERALAEFARLLQQAETTCRHLQGADRLRQRLPIPTYDELFGVESLVDPVLHYLHAAHRHPILSIKGIGGIGKTALADFVVRRLLDAGGNWQDLVWISAKQEYAA